jgi:hypothetical protein
MTYILVPSVPGVLELVRVVEVLHHVRFLVAHVVLVKYEIAAASSVLFINLHTEGVAAESGVGVILKLAVGQTLVVGMDWVPLG